MGFFRPRYKITRFDQVRLPLPVHNGASSNNEYSQALIARKCYPIAPDEHIPGQAITKTRRHQLRGNKVYVGQNVDLARFVVLSGMLVL